MSIMRRLRALDARAGVEFGQDAEEPRSAYLRRLAQMRFSGYVPKVVYEELVELRRQVDRLETRLVALEGGAKTEGLADD